MRSALTTSFLSGIQSNPDVPADVTTTATAELSAGIPFVSDAQLLTALEDAGVPAATSDALVKENADARLEGLRAALGILALIALVGLFFTRKLPTEQPAVVAARGEPARDGGIG